MHSSRYTDALKRLLMSKSTPKLGLSRMRALLSVLGNPERDFVSFHVAGTNGKGSTCAFLASLLEKAAPRVGLYTSPHLSSARERIQISGHLVDEELFSDAEEAVFKAAESTGEAPTFFERMTAMAFWIFAKQAVSAAVIEVGLGGRLDATNVVFPKISVITRIDLDHTDMLGNTLNAIAIEKAGIIKSGVPIVTGWQDEAALAAIKSVAREIGAPLTVVSKYCQHELGLAGAHQKQNAALAVEAIHAAGISMSDDLIASALMNTTWPGRFELICENPPTILDGAHNAAGMRSLVNTLSEEEWSNYPLVIVFGATQGHDSNEMSQALAPISNRVCKIIAAQSKSPRAIQPEVLAQALSPIAPCTIASDVDSALHSAKQIAEAQNALTVVCGSLFVVGEARSHFVSAPRDPEFPLY